MRHVDPADFFIGEAGDSETRGFMTQKGLSAAGWKIQPGDDLLQEDLIRQFGIDPIISRILIARGIFGGEEAKRFLFPSIKDLYNPNLMIDMDRGVDRLLKAVFNKERMMVYGDYDADGITSVVILLKFLQDAGVNASYYIPNRIREGYGLNRGAIDRFHAEGVSLLVTVDCGTSDHEEISYARSVGIDTIILDHHEVSDPLPGAVALINPHRKDCSFPFKALAAVGIVFNFLIALRGRLQKEGFWRDGCYPYLRGYLDLVSLGTLGDLVPLRDENRIFVKIGLELITEGKRTGIRALKTVCGIDDNQVVDTFRASFGLIPRINAAGRISSPEDAVRLLMSDDWDHAIDLAKRLDANNRKRQDMEKGILGEITESIAKESSISELSGALVFSSPSWHPGVIGIVAARLVERYNLPAVLISLKDGIGKGSARSVTGFSIHEGLKYCASHLLAYGGHQYAAGILIREEDIPAFSLTLKDFARRSIDPALRTGAVNIDACCQFRDIDERLVSQLDRLAPFGAANPEPLLCVRNVGVVSTSVVGNNHLRMRIAAEGVSCNSIWFGKGHLFQSLCEGTPVDIVFTPRLHSWSGSSEVQLKVAAVAPSSAVSSAAG